MKLVLNSITCHDCPVELRERVSFTPEQRWFMLKKMHAEQTIAEAVILETCNRIEFYVYAKRDFDVSGFLTELIGHVQPAALNTWDKYSRESVGIDIVRHLFEVAAGLDSQMLGENQILSQVKSAYTQSLDCRMSKFMFHRLFHNAFRVGKTVRADTNINCGAVSVSLAAVELAKREIEISAGTAMVIGAGENAGLVARYLLKASLPRLFIANRDTQKAQTVAGRLDSLLSRKAEHQRMAKSKKRKAIINNQLSIINVIGLTDIAGKLGDIDLLISSTAAAEPLITYKMVEDVLAHREKRLLIIDIAVPRDIDPEIGRFECVTLINIDDLNEQIGLNKAKRSSEVPKAQRIVAEFTDRFSKWYDSLNLVPVISQLTQKGIELAHSEAARYAKDFGEASGDKLERFAESLVKKILHGPISFLKAGADEEPSTEQLEGVDLINKMFLSQGEHEQ